MLRGMRCPRYRQIEQAALVVFYHRHPGLYWQCYNYNQQEFDHILIVLSQYHSVFVVEQIPGAGSIVMGRRGVSQWHRALVTLR